ncbi:hypothetical protein G3T14_24110 [Methylobacterium sp. BTF04]|uniref:hypothetical protein n=1 Tax=Methylobacterium sp. BTF04 TaxID=2708300 RepID=UPI0013D5D5FB|nr:hypothetical protein [Methylobacterium sp. BTF04]NEU15116.1 hypothetical protein [Methylobacterium sp. BTF04]
MRATHAFALAILASATFVSGAAIAGEMIHLTPPLFREHARETQQVRSVSDLSTTPQPVAVAKPSGAPRTAQIGEDVATTGSF